MYFGANSATRLKSGSHARTNLPADEPKLIALQQSCQHDLHFSLGKCGADAVPWPAAKGQIRIGWAGAALCWKKAVWIKYFWLWPVFLVPVCQIY